MFAKDGRKQKLQQLRDQLAELSTQLPREARGLRRAIAAADAEIAERLEPSLRGVKAADLEAFEQRIAALRAGARDLPGLLRDVTAAIVAERTLAAKSAGAGDHELAAWQAQRCREREARLAAAADQVTDAEGIEEASKTLHALALQAKHDGAALSLYAEARERVRTLGAAGGGKALADALPGLRQALIHHGPQPEWARQLLALVEPLRGVQPRQRPPQLEQVFERLERLSDWIEILRDDATEAAHPGENRLRRLSTRYHEPHRQRRLARGRAGRNRHAARRYHGPGGRAGGAGRSAARRPDGRAGPQRRHVRAPGRPGAESGPRRGSAAAAGGDPGRARGLRRLAQPLPSGQRALPRGHRRRQRSHRADVRRPRRGAAGAGR